ncbi:MAG: hypothetical protein Q9209_005882 [Squamulea sp. 1 TL-2023]
MSRKRDFKATEITECGYQSGAQRFSQTQPPPKVSPYRNNLVAFSQYYNLCFVASQESILIHTPIYLNQTLLPPRSIINLASSNSGLIGFIDHAHPHSINQLVVANLGIEELVIAVTDDGDVVAYTTRSIRDDINHHGSAYNIPCFHHNNIKPYFLRNVGMSTWGVAVHQEARMIAVSSNSTRIHVFAFALTLDLDHRSSALDDSDWVRVSTQDNLLRAGADRSRNLEIILTGHETNIPSVAFYNSYDRAIEDIFLVSTDIDGATYVWDVWKQKPVTRLISPKARSRGWGLACIDPFFLRRTISTEELFGLTRGAVTKGSSIEITHALPLVPGYESSHFTSRHRMKNHVAIDDLMDVVTNNEGEDLDDYVHDLNDDEGEGSEPEEYDDSNEGEVHTANGDHRIDESTASAAASSVARASVGVPDAAGRLTFCVLQTTQHDARLVHMLRSSAPTQAKGPRPVKEILCRSILDQRLHPHDQYLARLQRLNMVHHVPELCIVVIGDQMGRVALLAMTRRQESTVGLGNLDDVGFRVEAFLPYKSQEDAGQRPKTELLGVAVGPVQGHEQQREDLLDTGALHRRRLVLRSRAYRVMLYYRDHTVLSYEIKR